MYVCMYVCMYVYVYIYIYILHTVCSRLGFAERALAERMMES